MKTTLTKTMTLALWALLGVAAGGAECPTWISVMKFAKGHEAEVAADAAKLGNESFVNGMAWCANLQPTGDPVADIASDFAAQYREINRCFRQRSKVKNGILLQATMGHGGAPAVATPWQLCVQPDGRSDCYRMCPMDERFLAYVAGACRTVSTLDIDFFMVDDDTRMVWDNATPGCFCPLHLAEFGRRTGRTWTREAVVAMLKRGASRERDVWCEVKAGSLRRFFKTIRDNIRREVPGMLCICTNPEHVRHAREFATILAAPGQTPTIRGGGAPYHNGGDIDLFHLPDMLERYATQRAALGEGELVLMQEADTCPQTQWACSATREMNHLVVLALNGLKGAKIWITRSHLPGETKANAAYRRVFGEHRGIMRYAADVKLELSGLVSPVLPMSAGGISTFGSRYLAHLGIPYRVGEAGAGEVTVLDRGVASALRRERLVKILAGKVIVDGPAARWLAENGYAAEIGVQAKPWALKTIQRHRLEDGVVAFGIRSQDLTDLNAISKGAEILTRLDNVPVGSEGEYIAPGSVYYRNPRGGEVISLAYKVQGPTTPYFSGYIFTEFYKDQLVKFAKRLGGHLPGGVYYANDGRVLCQGGRTADGDQIVAVTILGLDDDPAPEFRFDRTPAAIERLGEADGGWHPVAFEKLDNGTVRLHTHLHTQYPAIFRYRQAPAAADVTIDKPYFRWLFNGFGFQNSEANFLRIMPEDFRDQRVLKTFAELSPSFARVYTGFAEQSSDQLDAFADYYDLTFRKAGTTLYAVPCAMPSLPDTYDAEEYAEKVAKNLEYLIKVRNCRKLRYYCLSNELMAGDRWNWFATAKRWDVYKKFNQALFHAFRNHALDIRLLSTDEAATTKPECVYDGLDWARTNMNDYVGAYCTHWYVYGRRTDDLGLWNEYNSYFSNLVQKALSASAKRYILGEYGFHPAWGRRGVMVDDVSYHLRQPETRQESVLCKCEVGLAAMNQGAAACVDWSFVDYPDPFVIEDGDTSEEHARYEAGRCGYRIDTKYNKCGVFRWCTTDRDYSAYEELYAMGWLVKLFRKNATVLPCRFADPMLRGGAVVNPDRSVSIALINRGPARTVTVDCSGWKTRVDGTPSLHQPLRRYVYDSAHVPYNAFNDLQAPSGTVTAKDGRFEVALPAKSMTFLTTDYEDVVPASVEGLQLDKARLIWKPATSPNHRYYRVYREGRQIASTVVTYLPLSGAPSVDASKYAVTSVDKWGNEGRR